MMEEEKSIYIPAHRDKKIWWTAESFIKEYDKLKNDCVLLPPIFSNMMIKIDKIIEHWNSCYFCKTGFYYQEHRESFEDLLIKLIYFSSIGYYTCTKENLHKL